MTKTPQEIAEELAARRAQSKGGSKDTWTSFKMGKYLIRVGKPWKKNGEFWKDVYYHGGFNDKVYCRKNELDPETGKPKRCKVCDRVKELKTDRSTFGKKLWALIAQRSESLWNIATVKKSKLVGERIQAVRYEDNKFKVLRLSSKWRDMLMDIFADEDYKISAKSILGITHPKRGRLVKLRRSGKGRDDTSYTFTPEGAVTPILVDKERRLKFLATLNDLDAMVHASSKEELEAFLEKAEKEAKRQARKEKDGDKKDEDDEDEEDGEETDETSEEDDDADGDDEDDDEDDDDNDGESDEEDDDDDSSLEKKYKAMKKKLKNKKREKEEED